jgi:hypothetical protein
MFVDDSYLFHSILKNIHAINLMGMIGHNISRWAKLLWTSGGAINFDKTSYSMLIWKFKDNGIAELTLEKELPRNSVNISNPTKPSKSHTIKRKCITTSIKTL